MKCKSIPNVNVHEMSECAQFECVPNVSVPNVKCASNVRVCVSPM